ncbi:HlyD family secretion protein [Propionicicella superfundia]|uniref:HlyD family secretion protein n=1 Tax=Propionicicella superfundia TaxID=348582 RepID=UPI0004252E3E|nr:efflux RND transporter periplasmic adaptor subunit [Propionicicella superfundia]
MAHRRPPTAVIVIVVLVLVTGGGLAAWWLTRDTASTAGRDATGTVEATTYDVASVIAGRVTRVLVSEGATVKTGDVVVTLDDAALKLQVAQAEQGVNAAKAAVTQARDDGTAAELAAAQARQKQAEAAVSLAEVQQGYAAITAPHDGIVVTVATNAGQAAAAGRTLVTIVDTSDLFVRTYVPEPDLGRVSVGRQVSARSDSSDATYPGTVSFVSSTAEFTPDNVETSDQRTTLVFQARIRLSDPSGALKPGMPVDLTFE